MQTTCNNKQGKIFPYKFHIEWTASVMSHLDLFSIYYGRSFENLRKIPPLISKFSIAFLTALGTELRLKKFETNRSRLQISSVAPLVIYNKLTMAGLSKSFP